MISVSGSKQRRCYALLEQPLEESQQDFVEDARVAHGSVQSAARAQLVRRQIDHVARGSPEEDSPWRSNHPSLEPARTVRSKRRRLLQMRSQANEDPTVTRQAIAAIWFRPLPDARVRLELQVRLLEGSFPTAAIGPLPGRRPVPMKKATVALARWTLLED